MMKSSFSGLKFFIFVLAATAALSLSWVLMFEKANTEAIDEVSRLHSIYEERSTWKSEKELKENGFHYYPGKETHKGVGGLWYRDSPKISVFPFTFEPGVQLSLDDDGGVSRVVSETIRLSFLTFTPKSLAVGRLFLGTIAD